MYGGKLLWLTPLLKLIERWAFCISGEQHAPNQTNLLSSRMGIFRFLYSERVSEVWEGQNYIKLFIKHSQFDKIIAEVNNYAH